MASNRKLEGFVDSFKDGCITGWARALKSKHSVKVIAKVDDKVLSTTKADIFRSDLKSAGKGNGCFGFAINISKPAQDYVKHLGKEIEVIVDGEVRLLLDTVAIKDSDLSEGQLAALSNDLEEFEFSCLNQPTKINSEKELPKHDFTYRASKKLSSEPIGKLFKAANIGAASATNYSYQPKPHLSAYLDFTRKRFCVENTFNTDELAEDVDNFLLWYIETYSVHRSPVKVPIGRSELHYLNELVAIPGCKYKLSRLHLQHILKYQPGINLHSICNDLSNYKNQIYIWCTSTTVNLNVEDCLIPESYITLMRSVEHTERTNAVPLTVMASIYFNENQDLHYLDLGTEECRQVFYAILLLKASKNTALLYAIPKGQIEKLSKEVNGKNKLQELYCKSNDGANAPETFSTAYLNKMFKERSFDLTSMVYLSLDSLGNRTEGNIYAGSLADAEYEFDVQLIGPINKASGLGQATRLSADILNATGLRTNVVDFGLDNPAKEGFNDKKVLSKLGKARINLIHLNAESLPLLFAYFPDYFEHSYNVGYFYWELDSPADCHKLGMDLVDEIWVSTDYGVEQYEPHVDKPVVNVGMAYEEAMNVNKDEGKALLEQDYGISRKSTVFLFAFDSFSFPERKNPLGTIAAFQKAFANGEDVVLLIKTHNRDFIVHKKQIEIWEQINHIVATDPRIKIVNETFKYADLLKFKAGCDCYVSLHRSEGWGFGMIEAMGLGVAVIATNYSGNLEFCNEENSWLVDYSLKYVDKEDYVFVKPGQQWAEPCVDSAAAALSEAYSDSELRKQKSNAGKCRATKDFSVASIASRYKARISQIIENLNTSY